MDKQRYSQIIPADRWFYEHKHPEGGTVRYSVACWAVTCDGDVVGLIAPGPSVATAGDVPRLIEPPPINGRYFREGDEWPA